MFHSGYSHSSQIRLLWKHITVSSICHVVRHLSMPGESRPASLSSWKALPMAKCRDFLSRVALTANCGNFLTFFTYILHSAKEEETCASVNESYSKSTLHVVVLYTLLYSTRCCTLHVVVLYMLLYSTCCCPLHVVVLYMLLYSTDDVVVLYMLLYSTCCTRCCTLHVVVLYMLYSTDDVVVLYR